MSSFGHLSVMAREVIEGLNLKSSGVYIDGTLGGAGHSKLILEGSAPNGFLIGIDLDDDALAEGRRVLKEFEGRFELIKGNFRDMLILTKEILGGRKVDGIVLDLGVSSYQLNEASRGFSFMKEARLDMRMDKSQEVSAFEIVNEYSVDELKNIFWNYGEEKKSLTAAKAIIEAREQKPIETTTELASILEKAIGAKGFTRGKKIHPATKVFQALRIAVNDELGSVEEGLKGAFDLLGKGGRLAVISFHSLEDRIVKNFLRDGEKGCICPVDFPRCRCGRVPTMKLVGRKAQKPGEEEIEYNPRARSARLRVAEKL